MNFDKAEVAKRRPLSLKLVLEDRRKTLIQRGDLPVDKEFTNVRTQTSID